MSYITTPDGKNHWVMSTQDVFDVIVEYTGHDVRTYFAEYDAQLGKMQETVDALRDQLEWERDDNARLLVEIRDEVDELRSKPRIDRSTLNRTLSHLYDMCNEVL